MDECGGRDAAYIGNGMLRLELPGRKEGEGRPKRRLMDVVKAHMLSYLA